MQPEGQGAVPGNEVLFVVNVDFACRGSDQVAVVAIWQNDTGGGLVQEFTASDLT